MKRIISFFSIVLIGAGFFFCASSSAFGQTGSSVWKITKDGRTMFLGGSVHVLRDIDYPLPSQFDRAFSQSSIMVFETDTEKLSEANVVQYLLTKMLLPGDQTLRSVLSPDTYELLSAVLMEYRYPIESMAKFKPSMVMSILSLLQVQKLGFVQQGVDAYYLEKARNEKKAVAFLETVETQIDLLVTMGDGYENDFVQYSLQDMADTESGITMLLDEWKNGGISRTEASLTEMRDQWPILYKALITDRNAAWIPQIEQQLASGTVHFVIVGLAHLYGPDGLLRQLENSGCTVENF